jgi:hypothetical protein
MTEEKPVCIIESWFSNRRRMGLAALVSFILATFSILLHYVVAPIFGESDLVSGVAMIMSFVFISGFAVAFAVWLILSLEKNLKSAKIKSQ